MLVSRKPEVHVSTTVPIQIGEGFGPGVLGAYGLFPAGTQIINQ
jgi:hypothetical protein